MTILVVSGEESFRSGLVDLLRDDGHRVIEHRSPDTVPRLEALQAIDAALIDYQQPGDEWLRFARRLHRAHPGVPIVLATSHWSPVVERAARRSGVVVRKPIEYTDLHALLHRLSRAAKLLRSEGSQARP